MRRGPYGVVVLLAAILLSAAWPTAVLGAQIRVGNLSSGDELRYPVALLKGSIAGAVSEQLRITNLSSALPTRATTTKLFRGDFKALVELVPGNNQVRLESGVDKADLVLIYRPMTTPYVVRLVYLTDSAGYALPYPTQKQSDPQDYAAKLATAARLMQTFTAESLHELGFGRRTFRLQEDAQGQVIVHTVRAPKLAQYYQSRTGEQIWFELYPWVDKNFPMGTGKNLVIAAFARYDPVTRRTFAHQGLGGGGLAYFTNISLFSWPSSLLQVQDAFTDVTRVDPTRVSDDTVGRGTFWALASTTIGASLHELGHCFGLPHSTDQFSIMSRGFDFFTRAFVVAEPSRTVAAPPISFRDDQVAYWDPPMAIRLATHRWLRPDGNTGPTRVEARGLPAGWESAPIGTSSTLKDDQSVEVNSRGEWVVSAAGDDLWNGRDGGLLVYTRHSGDGSITMRLLSQQVPGDDGWTKTGPCFRESLEAGSRVVRLSYTSGNQLEPGVRPAANRTPVHPGEAGSGGWGYFGPGTSGTPGAGREMGAPIWLGIDRVGNHFGYYWSDDGRIWNQVAQIEQPFPAEMLVGIEGSNHGGDEGNQLSRLDNVRVSSDRLSVRAITNIQYEPLSRAVRVSWTPLTAAVAGSDVSYNVYLINANARQRQRANPVTIRDSSYVVPNLTSGTPYRFGVTAVVNGSESPLQLPLPLKAVVPSQ